MAQDPVKVDSKHYTVEFENDQVRARREVGDARASRPCGRVSH